MSLRAPLVLASGVALRPVSRLPERTRAQLIHRSGDVAVSRAGGRGPTRVVSRDAAALLRQFTKPTLIVDAVLRFARRKGADPEATLDGAFEMLSRLYRARLLVAPLDIEGPSRAREGDDIEGWQLLRRVHSLEDTDVFYARGARGREAAVKLVEGDSSRTEREAEITRRAGARVPEVLGSGTRGAFGWLALEWIAGEPILWAAAALRGRREARSEAALIALVSDMVQSIADLHDRGVLHGDIHPGNFLAERDGRIRVVDLGSATAPGVAHPRAGVAFYTEPELAAASLAGDWVPSSAPGEQYALAALVYLAWTGVHYLEFSLERDVLLRQIVEDEPSPFSRHHVPSWPALEAVLRRALSKAPGDRFASCADFAGALRGLEAEARRRDAESARAHRADRDPAAEAAAAFLERCGLRGEVLRARPLNAPFASINYGAAGVAYAIYRVSLAQDDARLLATADVWAQKALVLGSQEDAFHTKEIDINESTVGNAALFHSWAGVHATRALVAFAMGDVWRGGRALADYVTSTRVPTRFIDLALGKAGLLLGCAELVDATAAAENLDRKELLSRGDELRNDVAMALLDPEWMDGGAEQRNLGIAHGRAGLLLALLRWCQSTGSPPDGYRDGLAQLAALCEPHGAGIRWPVDAGGDARYMDGWCHGSAGHALLWALAHEITGDAEYATYAERAALSAWSTTTTLGTLCCGLAGVGYACAAAHRATGDSAWHERALRAARRAAQDRSKLSYRDSLYKGAVGPALLHLELLAGCARTPLLERR